MNLVDSSAWLEYFADGPNASFFSRSIQDLGQLVVPTLSIFEVFKRIAQQRGEGDALQAIAVMQQAAVVELTSPLALDSARLSLETRLPMADSIILATARAFGATLWTQDADFKDIEGVQYIGKKA
jgi:predicted nucleic acid-binding protein